MYPALIGELEIWRVQAGSRPSQGERPTRREAWRSSRHWRHRLPDDLQIKSLSSEPTAHCRCYASGEKDHHAGQLPRPTRSPLSGRGSLQILASPRSRCFNSMSFELCHESLGLEDSFHIRFDIELGLQVFLILQASDRNRLAGHPEFAERRCCSVRPVAGYVRVDVEALHIGFLVCSEWAMIVS